MLKIKAIEKRNPQSKEGGNLYYAQAVSTGTVDLERLAYLISNQSTVREGDCYAVILSMVHNVIDQLKQGKIIRIDRLGSFQLRVNSEGVPTIEQVNTSLIKSIRIGFRPDKKLKSFLNLFTLSFDQKRP